MGLNDTYWEDFETATIARLFTTTACTLVAPDAITIIRATIVDTVLLSSTADRTATSHLRV